MRKPLSTTAAHENQINVLFTCKLFDLRCNVALSNGEGRAHDAETSSTNESCPEFIHLSTRDLRSLLKYLRATESVADGRYDMKDMQDCIESSCDLDGMMNDLG